MAPSMARLVFIISLFSSLFLLSLARHSIDLETKPETQIELATKPKTLLPEESNTTVESTELEILDPTKKVEEERNTQPSNLALPDESSEREVVVESDPGMIITEVIGWQPREDEEKKEEKVVRKKGNESDSDSDSDSDDEEEEKEERKKKRKKGKKLGFWKRLWKLINPFDYSLQ